MKRFTLGLALILLGSSLFAQDDGYERPPAIGRCDTAELRIRVAPRVDEAQDGSLVRGEEAVVLCRSPQKDKIDGLEAPWYQVCGMDGNLGWVFGGYFTVDAGRIAEVSYGDYEPPSVEMKDYGEGFAGGSLVLVRVGWREMYPAEFKAMFIKARGSAPKVLFTDFAEDLSFGRLALGKVDFLDLAGDAKEEICVTVSGDAGDSNGIWIRVYGDLGKGYAYLGNIHLEEGSGGGGELFSGVIVESGPLAMVEKGKKVVKVVKRSVSTGYTEGERAGERTLVETTSIYEEVYEIVGSKLVCTRTKDLSVVEKKLGDGGLE